MEIQISEGAAYEAVISITSLVEAGTGSPAQVVVWSGAMPAKADDSVTTDCRYLVTFDLPSPAFGGPASVEGAVEALAFAVPMATAIEAGMASFYRVYNKSGDVVWQAEVGATGPGSDAYSLLLNQKTITVGAEVTIEKLVIGYPV